MKSASGKAQSVTATWNTTSPKLVRRSVIPNFSSTHGFFVIPSWPLKYSFQKPVLQISSAANNLDYTGHNDGNLDFNLFIGNLNK